MSETATLPLKFSLSELAGSFGDFGTIIPLIIAVALVSDVDPRYILLFFGIWFILTGLYYRLPIPLEPMKAVAVIVIAGGITRGEIAAAGLVFGVVFLVLGYGRFFAIIERWVPESVVRGIQLGLALLLFRSSAGFIIKDALFFSIGIAIIVLFIVLVKYRSIPDLSSLCVIGAGFIGGILISGMPPVSLIPAPQLIIPLPSDFPGAFSTLVLPQLPLTIANAILATSLLTKDLFGKDIPPKEVLDHDWPDEPDLRSVRGVPDVPRCGRACRPIQVRRPHRGCERVCRPDLPYPCPLFHFSPGAFHHCSWRSWGTPSLYRD